MWRVLCNILCDLDPKVNIREKRGICDGVSSTAALVYYMYHFT